MKHKQNTQRSPSASALSFREKIGYGTGDLAMSIFWQLFGMFLMYFYTDVFGLSAAAVGTMFLVTRVWDTANDVIAGVICDRTKSRWGKFRPWLLWAALPLVITGYLTFSTPDLGATQKLIYAYITYTLVGMAYTMINVPYGALLGVMSPNPDDRVSLASYKFVLAFVGCLVVQALTLPLVAKLGGGNEALGFKLVLIIYGVVAIALFYVTFASTRERVEPPKEQDNNFRRDIKNLLSNGPWLATLGVGMAVLLCVSIRNGSIIYYFKYYVGKESLATSFMVAGSLAAIVGTMLVKPVAVRLGKRNTFIGMMVLSAVLMGMTYLMKPDALVELFVLQVVINLISQPAFALLWSMLSDVADYGEWKDGRRATGLVFSAGSMALKMGWTIGGAITGWVLAGYGFEANVEQTERGLEGIRLLLSLLPMGGAILTAIALWFYPLTEKRMREIEADLTARRKGNNNEF
ncbi:Inner membrane symporter YicJ [Pontiella desulfatans]|uniref:Inner membrane symporter YicJ n=1 Tax=Pontiella desulfatans TaxID=2750659 RepID=A0A6C2U291_PONDE|nr:MFS transporter [Pontiella desulfatans]VGO13987.1 Inner membrane symporter YicJ [Pontiella desulfatans]